MGRKQRNLRRAKKMNERRAQKAAKAARYKAEGAANRTAKSIHQRKGKTGQRHPYYPGEKCGNLACKLCNPHLYTEKEHMWAKQHAGLA